MFVNILNVTFTQHKDVYKNQSVKFENSEDIKYLLQSILILPINS